ncbi:MAG: macrolide ABC transporter ATP-binding protein [Candidatus Raymondbacteria bacterium RifOxyA12_full_50_37]|uniref:Macrolide ABC transporter ATP-binding protein n=1 Tax=Candidatus Raymondbacteria bacterium RIFOXYD12_FULL_49_13 TaxID=1817890 RepID=A0A1F7F8P7_UNCRA|nr:MAG: macrolide ABC transporter ATP-binding protein [Candidatus Raymondbacteria bacterium RifOxyA12_full_50_37]OGJ85403.1 MAG: macrolide ABC transporter ATP-binding protein [Candidatus Raymondbacteria bacterium RIFOXYA2_FULL_49_16]OGJ94911.1 MAG: macrolide ABC transporter ATP-binding protein [Candidatus Raymondbacteria bacterium RIFOXYC2_FULL_50_21]OGK03029.1 MAG: macrolide ABC transporter ATP-binding protein [Candidatus Raymondbacteria bacterium RIFOXYD12_FULL_49_13]OGP45543.1 MAG: macrolide
MDIATVLETKDLCKSYYLGNDAIQVLFDVNLCVRKGDFSAIMGPSGSGKSTLLNILGCLDTPTSGEYLLNGLPVKTLSQSRLADIRNREIGFVFQNFNLLPKLDVFSNVELPLIYGNVSKKERHALVEESLKSLGLWERRHHRPNEISGGQKQRAAIARALVKKPCIILADEPTGNLDSVTTHEILELFKELNARGNTILVITHESEVAGTTNKVFHIRDGRLYHD